jgi:hypothetical protein
MQEEGLAGGQVQNGEAENAVKIMVDVGDRGLEFLPEDLLLFLGGCLGQDGGGEYK